ncbi:MAG TPA: type II toxin-antitoxin system RelE/ParE family toxin [Pyrinomonadaceae bacterium]|nr:type II toxin-antitoxin system RelE/ParE family toxin [Pyrinomonadaceae bacterium]
MKVKPVVTRHQADDDIDRAFEYYLSEGGREVAVAFIDDYERSVSHLSRFPLSGSPRLEHKLSISDLRQWSLRRFPYLILYFDREHSVEIWRVLHGHMDLPAWLRDE